MMDIYYYDELLEEEIPSKEAISLPLEIILEKFYNLSETKNSYFGIIGENNIIQFQWIKEDVWLVDIPNMKKNGSFQKQCDFRECVNIIKQNSEKRWEMPRDFIFNKW